MSMSSPASGTVVNSVPERAGSRTTESRPRVYWTLQAGRGIAALMVLFFHCDVLLSRPKYWNHSWSGIFNCGHSGVDFFFVLSGIVILHAHWKDLGQVSKLRTFVWKRFRRIYPIYWIVLAATLPLFFLNHSFGFGFEREPSVLIQSFLLVHITRVDTILQVAWTLYHEVLFYFLFATFLISRKLGTIIFSLWMLASIWALFSPPSNPVLAQYFSPLHLQFALGMGVIYAVRRYSLPGLPLAIIGTAGFIACCIYDNRLPEDVLESPFPFLHVAYGICAALLITGFMFLEQGNKLHVHKFWIFLGEASYAIYLVHVPVLSASAKVLYRIWKNHPVPLIVPFLTMAALGIGAGIIVHVLLEKPLLRLLSESGKLPPEVASPPS